MLRFPSLASLPDHTLRADLVRLVADDCATTARMLAYLVEFEDRRLFLDKASCSMPEFWVGEQHCSEDVAFQRLHAARAAREAPALVQAIGPADEPPAPDAASGSLAPEMSRSQVDLDPLGSSPRMGSMGPEASAKQCANVTPLSLGRYALQATIDRETHDKLRYARALLGHVVGANDLAQVLDRALDEPIVQFERRKFAACARSAGLGGRRGPRRWRDVRRQAQRGPRRHHSTRLATSRRGCGHRALGRTRSGARPRSATRSPTRRWRSACALRCASMLRVAQPASVRRTRVGDPDGVGASPG